MYNLTGSPPFGRLTVIERGPNNVKGRIRWYCDCTCGTRCLVLSESLRKGATQSCGCLNKELARQRERTHGLTSSPEWHAWGAMKKRCVNPRDPVYHHYGGRGIAVCERWLHSFENFYTDMGPRPSASHSIERKKNDLGYSPDNCVWETRQGQMRNTRMNHYIRIENETKCLTEWLEIAHMHAATFHQRCKRGWSEERALMTPPNPVHATKKHKETIKT